MEKAELIEKLKMIKEKTDIVEDCDARLSGTKKQIENVKENLSKPRLKDVSRAKRGHWGIIIYVIVFALLYCATMYEGVQSGGTSVKGVFETVIVGIGKIADLIFHPIVAFASSLSDGYNVLSGLAVFLLFPFIIALIGSLILGPIHRNRERAKMEEWNQKMLSDWEIKKPQCQSQLANLEKNCTLLRKKADDADLAIITWSSLLGLHENYRNSFALGFLIRYLEAGRSDTLKEAINLYEQERREDARDEAEYQHRIEMQRRARAIQEETARSAAAAEEAASNAKNAASNAEDAAFWGAAATYIAAKNSEKLEK